MGQFFPDFASTARLGFQSGMEMGQGQNPLGQFIRSMLADWQQRRAVSQEIELYKGKEDYKQKLESSTPEAQARTRYYNAQADYMDKAASGIGENADVIYRRGDTAEEVPGEQAKLEIAQGNRDFVITQRQVYKSGVRETPIIKPPDLTKEEKEYTITSKRIQKRLGGIQNLIPEIREKGYGELANFAVQSRKIPYIFLRDKSLKDLKSNIDAVKADIPFLRGGKQLTPEEGRRVDILLSPFGKSDEIYQRDIQQFMDEFTLGERLMREGVTALNPITQRTRGKDDLISSFMKKYPNRSRDEIINAMKKQGLI